jgi:putative DNA primase/helicase
MTAEILARVRDGRTAGRSWIVHRPAHEDGKPSLSVGNRSDGKVLVHCHAGCERARVIAALSSRELWMK